MAWPRPDGAGPAWDDVAGSRRGGRLTGGAAGPGLPRCRRRWSDGGPAVDGVRRAVVLARAAGRRGAGRPHVAHLRRLHLRPRVLRRLDPAALRCWSTARGVPGLRPPGHRLPPLGRPARPVRERLHRDRRPRRGSRSWSGADASHAWCSAYVPGWGWLDLDPTNDQVAPAQHVTVGWGRDYRDVAPLRGVVVGPAAPQELDGGRRRGPAVGRISWRRRRPGWPARWCAGAPG